MLAGAKFGKGKKGDKEENRKEETGRRGGRREALVQQRIEVESWGKLQREREGQSEEEKVGRRERTLLGP